MIKKKRTARGDLDCLFDPLMRRIVIFLDKGKKLLSLSESKASNILFVMSE